MNRCLPPTCTIRQLGSALERVRASASRQTRCKLVVATNLAEINLHRVGKVQRMRNAGDTSNFFPSCSLGTVLRQCSQRCARERAQERRTCHAKVAATPAHMRLCCMCHSGPEARHAAREHAAQAAYVDRRPEDSIQLRPQGICRLSPTCVAQHCGENTEQWAHLTPDNQNGVAIKQSLF